MKLLGRKLGIGLLLFSMLVASGCTNNTESIAGNDDNLDQFTEQSAKATLIIRPTKESRESANKSTPL